MCLGRLQAGVYLIGHDGSGFAIEGPQRTDVDLVWSYLPAVGGGEGQAVSTTARVLWKQSIHSCTVNQTPRAKHMSTYGVHSEHSCMPSAYIYNACSPPGCFVSVCFTPRAHPCMHKTTNEWQGRGDTDGRRPVCALPRPSTRNKVLPCFASQTTVAVGGSCGRSHRRTAIPRSLGWWRCTRRQTAMLVLGVGRASRLRTTWRLRVEQKLSLHP